MTREELVGVLEIYNEGEWTKWETADRILAALEKEREGEVVLGNIALKSEGNYDGSYPLGSSWITEGDINVDTELGEIFGLDTEKTYTGQLIFRPTKAKEAGK